MRAWCDFGICSITRRKRLLWQPERRAMTWTPIGSSTSHLFDCSKSSAKPRTERRPDERAQYRDIPWAQIVGLRNRLIHGYDSVDFEILWQIINHDLPPLIEALEQIVSS